MIILFRNGESSRSSTACSAFCLSFLLDLPLRFVKPFEIQQMPMLLAKILVHCKVGYVCLSVTHLYHALSLRLPLLVCISVGL